MTNRTMFRLAGRAYPCRTQLCGRGSAGDNIVSSVHQRQIAHNNYAVKTYIGRLYSERTATFTVPVELGRGD